MSRFLIVSLPFVAHVNPTVSIGRELMERGHDVAWVVHSTMRHLLPEDGTAFLLDDTETLAASQEAFRDGNLALPIAYKLFMTEVLAPFAHSMRQPVEDAIEDFGPDAMLVDHHAVAGAFQAQRHGIPWATSAPSGQLFSSVFDEMPRIQAWAADLLGELQMTFGIDSGEVADCSRELVLLYTTREFVGERAQFPAHFKFVGGLVRGRVDNVQFPYAELDSNRRMVIVSMGSILNQRAERFYQVAADALGTMDVQVIVSAPEGALQNPPANFIVRPWLPLLELLAKADLLITHGGSTVNEALAFAVPMVVAPITWDQFIFAGTVADCGAGQRVRFNRVTPDELRAAVEQVLEMPSYREAAARIQESFAAAGGTRAAADALEELVSRP